MQCAGTAVRGRLRAAQSTGYSEHATEESSPPQFRSTCLAPSSWTLLCLSSALRRGVQGGECPVEVTREIALEAAANLASTAPFRCPAFDVGTGCWVVGHPHDGRDVQRPVQPAVSAAIQPVPDRVARTSPTEGPRGASRISSHDQDGTTDAHPASQSQTSCSNTHSRISSISKVGMVGSARPA